MALTKRQVDAQRWDPAGPPQQVLYDGDLDGFGVRIYPSGKQSFVVRYRAQGRRRWFTIGPVGVLTVQQARERAQRVLAKARDGADPLAERQDARGRLTFRQFAAEYLERHAKPHKRSWREDERRLDAHLLPALGARRLDAITRADIARLHAAIGAAHPHEANRVLALASVIFAKAIEWGQVPDGTPNPARGVTKQPEQSRDRWVLPVELPTLLEAIAKEPDPYHRAAFHLYLLTGVRRSELTTLQWRNVDLAHRTLTLDQERTKAKRAHVVPLPPQAVAIFQELAQLREARARDGRTPTPYVFPAKRRDTRARDDAPAREHLGDLRTPWQRIRKAAKLTDVRLHDLRRTVGSMLAQDGASLPLIGKVLNHSSPTTTQVYARLTDDTARAALERHAERLGQVIDLAAERAKRVG